MILKRYKFVNLKLISTLIIHRRTWYEILKLIREGKIQNKDLQEDNKITGLKTCVDVWDANQLIHFELQYWKLCLPFGSPIFVRWCNKRRSIQRNFRWMVTWWSVIGYSMHFDFKLDPLCYLWTTILAGASLKPANTLDELHDVSQLIVIHLAMSKDVHLTVLLFKLFIFTCWSGCLTRTDWTFWSLQIFVRSFSLKSRYNFM